jgi:signal transduction histidine kinase
LRLDGKTLFPGGGEAGELVRSLDWSATPLGPAAAWPGALKALVRAMLHARQPMLLWWGPQLTQVYNDAFRPSFGEGKHPHAMGQGARECWAEVWPVVGQQLEEVIASGKPSWFEDVLVPIYRNGRLEDAWWIYNYSPAFDDHGALAGVLIICTETTQGVQARQQLQHASRQAELARQELNGVFMQAPQPIAILTGPEHRFTLANGAYEKFVGRSVLGKTLAEAFSDDEVGYYRPIIEQVYRSGVPTVIREAPLQLPNAAGQIEDRYIDVAYHPYRAPDLAVLGVMAVINDVTPSVAARKELERTERERAGLLAREQALRLAAEAGGRARDEFLAMLGHELRNPLAPIATATQLMRLRPGNHDKERQIIERQVTHLSRLVDDLLDVSRVARGKIDLQRRPLEIAEVVAKAVEMTSPLLEERAHRFTMDVPTTGLVVDGDSVRLAQVVGNLLNNAAKYSRPGGIIELSARLRNHEVVVTVSDRGPGIDAELLPRIFDLFVQGQQRIDRAQGGLGLGLALVKNLVGLHGGWVRASNRPEGGSEFAIALPALSVSAQQQQQQQQQGTDRLRPARTLHKILVVDDNEDAAELLSELLRGSGHEVMVAHDGPGALDLLTTFAADIGLLDIGLPGMDGYELARQIRQLGTASALRLIAVTGYGQENDRNATRVAGFDRHLTKPISLDDLTQILGE